MAKGILITLSLLLLCVSSEVISWGIAVVWLYIGLAWLLKEGAKGGAFD